MAVSVIVPARNAAETLPSTLAALARQTFDGAFEVIVVDNGSNDTTAAIARASGVRVVNGPGRGAGSARHAGVAEARHPLLAFTDADCAPEPEWLRAGLAALEGDVALVQGWVGPPDGVFVGPWDRTLNVRGPRGFFEAANLFVRRDAYDAVGGFGDGLVAPDQPPFGEDVLFGWALRRRGYRTVFAADARVRHWVFVRGLHGRLVELERRALFAHLIREVPELRQALWGKVFLGRRDALLLAGGAGLLLASGTRRPGLTLAALPWSIEVARDWRGGGPRLAVGRAACDAWSLAFAAWGSLRARTLVL